jgi:nodulation protein E
LRRVVVTGIGAVSPLGHDTASYVAGLNEGRSGMGAPTIRGAEKLSTRVVAEVKGFDPGRHFSDRQLTALDRVSQFAVVAGGEAIAQSGLSFENGLGERTAAIIGTGVGGQTTHDDNFHRSTRKARAASTRSPFRS